MRSRWFGSVGFVLLCLTAALPAKADDAWRTRAVLDTTATGLIEALVPPELVSRTGPESVDFSLSGPDGRPRAFELYWREPVGSTRVLLEPTRVQLDQAKEFTWEADLHEKLVIRRLQVSLTGQGVIGRIDVDGRLGDKWISLARHAAVFATAGVPQATIDIPADAYEALRLHLTGFDRRARQTLAPIKTVTAEGDRLGKDYVEEVLALTFQQTESEGIHVIEAALPGDGLWISSLHLKTEAQFQGDWQAGRERICDGSRCFEAVLSGRRPHLERTPRDLGLDVMQTWPGRSLVLKLDAGERFIGEAASLTATVRLPRLIFVAEKAGRYTAMTGTGKSAAVLKYPGDSYRQPQTTLSFAVPEINPEWHLATLVEKYRLKGGPFSPEGYTWQAPVSIAAPGYYRLPLNLQASLAPMRTAVRMVRDSTQIPYLAGRLEDHLLDLEITPVYDARKNISTWIVQLPQASPYWKELMFYATGIFQRTIEFEKPKPGTRGWQPWRHMMWESRGERETALRLSLRDLPDGTDVIRLVMPHGDNQPVSISRITAAYTAPTVYFLAAAAGNYTIYGGNPRASVPQYDLSLVQAELFSTLPSEARMGAVETFQSSGWKNRISAAFTGKSWGLYAVLGLVTLVLIMVIVRLFPKPGDRESS
jgi:hypothetical protein